MGIEFTERPKGYYDFIEEVISDFKESRHEERFDKVFKVTFLNPKELIEEYTQNISLGGMYITTENPPALGETVEVRMLLGDTLDVIHVEAEVVHVVTVEAAEKSGLNPGIGVQFAQFFDDDGEKLRNYIMSLKQFSQ